VDTQHTLPFATAQQVQQEVEENVRTFMTGGGYVFNNVHNIQAGVPVENIMAMFRAVAQAGIYSH
jgi:uroporphyrinogen decarboxylase